MSRLLHRQWQAADLRIVGAAIAHQIIEERTHALAIDGVENIPALAARAHQAHALELLEMEGQRRRRDLQGIADRASGLAFRPRTHQPAEDGEPRLLRQRTQGGDDLN